MAATLIILVAAILAFVSNRVPLAVVAIGSAAGPGTRRRVLRYRTPSRVPRSVST